MIDKKVLNQMYVKDNKSMQEIAGLLNCSLHKVQYWMDKYGIVTRSRSQAAYIKYNPDGDPFSLKQKFNRKDLVLLGVGLGLWWGEGSKRHHGCIRLGNTDPKLIKKFIEFLEQICGVQKHKIRFGLQVFSDMAPDKAKQFWIKSLKVSPDRFHSKVIVTESKKKGTYRKKIKHGVLTIYCSNIKLKEAFDKLMEKYAY